MEIPLWKWDLDPGLFKLTEKGKVIIAEQARNRSEAPHPAPDQQGEVEAAVPKSIKPYSYGNKFIFYISFLVPGLISSVLSSNNISFGNF